MVWCTVEMPAQEQLCLRPPSLSSSARLHSVMLAFLILFEIVLKIDWRRSDDAPEVDVVEPRRDCFASASCQLAFHRLWMMSDKSVCVTIEFRGRLPSSCHGMVSCSSFVTDARPVCMVSEYWSASGSVGLRMLPAPPMPYDVLYSFSMVCSLMY